jgi:hypothetical protein
MRKFTGKAVSGPIIFKCPYRLQAEPFKLSTRASAHLLGGHISIAVIPWEINSIFENGFAGNQNAADNFSVEVRTLIRRISKQGRETG